MVKKSGAGTRLGPRGSALSAAFTRRDGRIGEAPLQARKKSRYESGS